MNAIAIGASEARRLFRKPLAWIVLALGEAFMAVFFMLLLIRFLDQENVLRKNGVTVEIMMRYFGTAALVVLLLTPILTMNVLSGDRRDGALRFLFAMPVSATDIVAGKLLGVLTIAGALWSLIGLLPLTLLWGAPIDLGVYGSNMLGLALFMLLCNSLGVLASAVTRQPAVAGSLALIASLGLWVADWAAHLDTSRPAARGISTLGRLRGFELGLLVNADIVYFLLGSLAFLLLAVWFVDAERRYS